MAQSSQSVEPPQNPGRFNWPAVYLIDKQGKIVYSHFGEGSYGTTEKKIQALLAQPASASALTSTSTSKGG